MRSVFCIIVSLAVMALFGCGGGDGTAGQALPTRAIVKIRTSGTLPGTTIIAGISATVIYQTTVGLSITASDVVPSGAGTGSVLAANVNNTGQVVIGIINAIGIQTGEFATLTFNIAQGNSPLSGDFSVAPGATVIDTNGAAIPGISVDILSVAFQ
jgi:hypothetical protein